ELRVLDGVRLDLERDAVQHAQLAASDEERGAEVADVEQCHRSGAPWPPTGPSAGNGPFAGRLIGPTAHSWLTCGTTAEHLSTRASVLDRGRPEARRQRG